MSLLKKNEKELLTVLGDPFRNKTKTNILISAEYLFGNKGINETSTRDINIHANLRNSSSLSYHFGNKENLIDSILTARISELEEIRMRNYNAMLKDKKNLSKKDLMKLLIGPVIEKISNDPLWRNFLSFYEQVIIFNDSEISEENLADLLNDIEKILGNDECTLFEAITCAFIKYAENFKDNKRDGESISYNEDGSIKTKNIYKDGKLIETKEY